VLEEILQERLEPRGHRRNRRAVKRKMSNFPRRRRTDKTAAACRHPKGDQDTKVNRIEPKPPISEESQIGLQALNNSLSAS